MLHNSLLTLTFAASLLSSISPSVSAAPLETLDNGIVIDRRATLGGCASGVHMIVARASTEAPGEGIIGGVVTKVKQQVPGSDSVAVVYPATLYPYVSSEAAGVSAMQQLLQQYTASCPDGKVALLGYSQGAHVVGDVLSGGATGYGYGSYGFKRSLPDSDEAFDEETGSLEGLEGEELDAALSKVQDQLKQHLNKRATPPTDNIVAVVQMGDPAFKVGQSYNVGTSTRSGLFARRDTSALDAIADKIQSYCDLGDEFCASGTSLATHLSYVTKYGTQAANFIVSKFNAA